MMTNAERAAVIHATGCFGSWIDIAYFDEVAVRAGERIAVEGSPCHELVIVAEGRLEARSGERIGVLGPGDAIGWAAMERRGPNEATVVAATDARLLVMSHAQFRAAAAPPPKRRFPGWALPSSRRSLPRRPTLERA
jgi:signal-transduction protein with cAMP-binding, CBS, and nucleotidyltransferase domain